MSIELSLSDKFTKVSVGLMSTPRFLMVAKKRLMMLKLLILGLTKRFFMFIKYYLFQIWLYAISVIFLPSEIKLIFVEIINF